MWDMRGLGRFVHWNVKYYLFCRKIVPVSKKSWSPRGFFFLVLRSITFCMSSLLFDWYSNALSVCLVLVVNLLWLDVSFIKTEPPGLPIQSECALLLFSLSTLFLLTVTTFPVFRCRLLGRASGSFRFLLRPEFGNRRLGLEYILTFLFWLSEKVLSVVWINISIIITCSSWIAPRSRTSLSPKQSWTRR